MTTDPNTYISLESDHSAHNYHPLDVVLTRAEGIWVWDVGGWKYMDFLSAYSAVNQGHNHPRIVEALIEQVRQLSLTSRAFHNDQFGPFCAKLSKLLGYDKVLMMNTGAEAVETAIKAGRRWGYREKGIAADHAEIIVFDGNFHGRTTTIVGFSSDQIARDEYGPFAPGFVSVPFGDLGAAEAAFGPNTVGVLVEPIQGEAGVVIPPDGFLAGLRKLCDQHQALLLCDEIQSGLGRSGALLAHTRDGVRADGVMIGKALSGGVYPVSAFLADDRVMQVFEPGSHGSTYGGNPIACAVASVAIDVLIDENLSARSAELGQHLLLRLGEISSSKIKQLRGAGLWVGIELQESAGGARLVAETLRGQGLLCKETQTHTLRLAPPLTITREDLDTAIDQITAALSD